MGIFGGGGGGVDMPIPKSKPKPKPIDDEERLRKLAQQRTSLEKKRKGRKSLVIPPSRNTGLSAQTISGLRVTE